MRSILFFLLCSFGVFAEEAWHLIQEQPAGKWVEKIAPAEEGKHLLLSDIQYHQKDQEYYIHIALVLGSGSDVESFSQLEIQFDPSFQSILLHDISVHRKGKKLNRLADCERKLIQREEQSGSLIYNGSKSLILVLEDIRKGDILEYSYTIKGNHPIFTHHDQINIALSSFMPCERLYRRCVVEDHFLWQMKEFDTQQSPEILEIGEQRIYVWDRDNVKPVKYEGGEPDWFSNDPHVQFSTFSNWSEVAEIYQLYFDEAVVLDGPLLEFIEDIKQGENPYIDAIRFVQDEIRYLYLHEGAEGFKAHDPNLVFERRFGDCKDKSFLLAKILRELGVEAHPVLVNTFLSYQILEQLPSVLFDHAIVHFELEGKDYFVDPTMTHQRGGLEELYLPPYRYGLILHDSCAGLTEIPFSEAPGLVKRLADYHLEGDDAMLTIALTAEGNSANFYRMLLDKMDLEEFSAMQENYYGMLFDEVVWMEGLTYEEDSEHNQLTLRFAFQVKNLGCWLRPILMKSYVSYEIAANRKNPFEIPFPLHFEEEIHIRSDDPFLIDEKDFVYQDQYVSFKLKCERKNTREATISSQIVTFQDAIAPQDITGFGEMLDVLLKKLNFLIFK